MHGHNLVAVFSSRSVADSARARLIDGGVAASDIRVSPEQSEPPTAAVAPKQEGGFFDWLFGDVPAEQQTWYAQNLREGRTAVSVYVRDPSDDRVRDILDEFNPIDIDEENPGSAATNFAASPEPSTKGRTPTAGIGESHQVIPLAKEELDVGKRQTERRYKIRTYVVERPVEDQVHLRDERVTIERRPRTGERVDSTADGLQGREFEVIERHEEPVVAKKSSATEEVVVRKEVADRTETVRDRVRETKVDIDKGSDAGKLGVDKAAAGTKPGMDDAKI